MAGQIEDISDYEFWVNDAYSKALTDGLAKAGTTQVSVTLNYTSNLDRQSRKPTSKAIQVLVISALPGTYPAGTLFLDMRPESTTLRNFLVATSENGSLTPVLTLRQLFNPSLRLAASPSNNVDAKGNFSAGPTIFIPSETGFFEKRLSINNASLNGTTNDRDALQSAFNDLPGGKRKQCRLPDGVTTLCFAVIRGWMGSRRKPASASATTNCFASLCPHSDPTRTTNTYKRNLSS